MNSASRAGKTFSKEDGTVSDMTTSGLGDLQPDPPARTLKRRFFDMMPEIDAALDRKVGWKKILAHLRNLGIDINPELASNYAAQYRRKNGSTRTRNWRARHSDASSRPAGSGELHGAPRTPVENSDKRSRETPPINAGLLGGKRLKSSPTAR